MNTQKTTFRAEKLDFTTLDTSEADFFTIEYTDLDFAKALGIMGGKVYLWVDDLFDKFSACLWIEGEPVIELDEETGEIVQTGEEQESHFMKYVFTLEELDAIKLRIIQYLHYRLHDGKDYALAEMSIPFGEEAWRKKYTIEKTPNGPKYVFKAPAVC